MYEYKDISALTRVVTIVLSIFAGIVVLWAGSSVCEALLPSGAAKVLAHALFVFLAVAMLATLFGSAVLVSRWIYRASANAHTMANDLTISAGWAVGWYFVPLAALWKPRQAMKEIWLASHFGQNWYAGEAPGLLNWWWGLWLVSSCMSRIIGPLAFIVMPVAGLLLIRLMAQVRDAQSAVRHAVVFA